jgi:hypothetical protein
MSDKLPSIIYKYRDWLNPYHKRIISHREIFLASPKDLNDPFDCRVTPNFGLLDSDEKIWDYIKVLGERNRDRLAKQGKKPEEFEKDLYDRLKNGRDEEQRNWDEMTYRGQDERYGVLSMSARWNSILMWGHYSLSHTGFCVGFHEKMIQDSGLFGRGGMIRYSTDFPDIHPKDDYTPERGFIETFTKAADWKYEEEYRLFKFLKTEDKRLVVIDPSFFAEVVVGLNFPEAALPEIFEIAGRLKVPVFKIIKVQRKFEIDRVELKKP